MTAGLEHRNGTSLTSGEKGGGREVMGGSEKEADKGMDTWLFLLYI